MALRTAVLLLLALTAATSSAAADAPEAASATDRSIALGNYNDRALVSRHVLLVEPTIESLVSELGHELLRATPEAPDRVYTFRIFNESTANSFTGGGGFVYVTTGMLDQLRTTDQLAAVLAHELAHDRLDHPRRYVETEETAKALSEFAGLAIGVVAAAGGLAGLPTANAADVTRLGLNLGEFLGRELDAIAGTAYLNGYKEAHEREADREAVRTLERADRPPCALLETLRLLEGVRRRAMQETDAYPAHMVAAEPGLLPRIEALSALLGRDGASVPGQVCPELHPEADEAQP